jgi:outer membrane lipoprotein-sorting protein
MADRTMKSGKAPVASSHRHSRVRGLSFLGAVFMAVALLVGVVGLPAGAAGQSPKAQLQAAAAAMQQVPGYAFSAAVGNGAGKVKIAGEYQAPDRIHEVVQIGTKPASELVMIGSEVYAKDTAGAWQRTRAANGNTADLRSTFAALQGATNVKRSGKNISFTLSPKAASSLVGAQAKGKISGQATVANGQITELRYNTTANGRKVPVKISYTFTNPTPTVSAPL